MVGFKTPPISIRAKHLVPKVNNKTSSETFFWTYSSFNGTPFIFAEMKYVFAVVSYLCILYIYVYILPSSFSNRFHIIELSNLNLTLLIYGCCYLRYAMNNLVFPHRVGSRYIWKFTPKENSNLLQSFMCFFRDLHIIIS